MNSPDLTRREFLNTGLKAAATGMATLTDADGLLAEARRKAVPLKLKVIDLKTFVANSGNKNFSFRQGLYESGPRRFG